MASTPSATHTTTSTAMNTAHILLAHGSRDPHWRTSLEAVAQRLNRAEQPTRCAYLELCEPSLLQTATALADEGCRTLRITPLFLGLGQHARTDLPVLCRQLQIALPHVQVQLQPALCDMPAFVDAVSALLQAAR
jgi:sirohydrochlorin cobaltochelatase